MSVRAVTKKTGVRWLMLGAVLPLLVPVAGGAPAETVTLEKLEVTGTRIKRPDIEGVSPVVVLDRSDIERSGATTTNELFRKVVYDTFGIVDETFTLGTAPASAGVDLRGLGVNRTLVLINGRRVPIFPFGQGEPEGSASFVDINLIPLGAIERVEVLKDGASAVYGSDAVAGVVNFILRQDYQGADLSVRLGQTSENDGEEAHLTFAGGVANDRGNLSFNVDYFDRRPVRAKDRDIAESALGPIDDRSLAGNPGTVIRAAGFPQPDPRCPADSTNPEKGPFCLYDYAPWYTLIPETQRLGLTASGSYDITDTLTFFGNAYYVDSESERDLAPALGFFGVGADNPNNIFPGEELGLIYRLEELGPRTDTFETDTYNLVGGLRGGFGDWEWELAGGASEIDTRIRGVSGYATQGAVQEAIDSGTLNPFGDSPDFDPAEATYVTERQGESRLYYVDFEATGDIYQLAHGALAAAVGAEYRNEEFSDQWDPITESGAVLAVGGSSGDGDRDVGAVFAEFSVPLLTRLEFQLAGRYDDYSDFGGTFNPKLGVRWQPLPSLLLRANGGTGFKAPALHELYSGDIVASESVFDPATGDVQEVTIIASGNPALDAEESRNYGLGLVWDVTDAWNLTLDYWRIRIEDAVNNDPQFYLNNEALFADNVIRDQDGNIVTVLSPFENIAEIETWGLDLDTSFHWGAPTTGDFRLGLVGTYLGSFEREPVPGAGFEELAGKDGRPRWRGQGILSWIRADFEGSLTVNYIGGYDRRLEGRGDDDVDSWTTVDAQFSWYPPPISGGKLTLGVENLFDEEPPEDPFFQGWPFLNSALHSARGRYVYLGYSHTF